MPRPPEQIDPVPGDLPILVANADLLLAFERQSLCLQLEAVGLLVDSFLETRSEAAMDGIGAADDATPESSVSSGIGAGLSRTICNSLVIFVTS
jgi:hypothetical protein